ncbi:MAG TPA: AgmX/PglI C-terminal domain-containing protein [Polyangiaceae bacterium]|nr:AgmX/PglI C-terminal domain-containing protein [Polyangiaceae bacterium]
MASLHPAVGTPAVFDHRVFASTHNPFLKSEPEPVVLRPLNQNAPLAESLEVTVLWGTNVLAVAQLSPPRQYAVGEVGGPGGAGTSAAGNIDFALSAERLGSARREIIALRNGAPFAVFTSNETPRVLEKGVTVDAQAAIVDCSDVAPGARGIELRQDRVVIIEASGVTFRLAGGKKPEMVPRVVLGGADRSAIATMGTAAILQGLLVASLAYLTPSMALADDEDANRDRMQLMQQYLHASADREHEQELQQAEAGGGEKGAPAERNRGPEGAAGKPENTLARHMAVAGHTAERALSHDELRKEATDFGTIGLLTTMNASNAPSNPWADLPTGPDAINATGDLFSQEIGEGHGFGGLSMSGIGQGGGGKGFGVGMGDIGTCSGLNCYGKGPGGFARDIGRTGPDHKKYEFHVRPDGNTSISGHLPADVIQRIVRQNFGRFRNCYEVGLRSNPNLEGRVTARFVIGRDGAVSNVSAGGDLPDAGVRSCVASAFYGLSFPSPDGGIVTVSYPIMLTPG